MNKPLLIDAAPAPTPDAAANDPALAEIRRRKLGSKIAARLKITRQAISLWTQVPWNRVLVVSEMIGWPPHKIRPDIYPAPPEGTSPDTAPLAPSPSKARDSKRNQKVTLA